MTNIKKEDGIELSGVDDMQSVSSDSGHQISDNPDFSTLLVYFITEILGTAMLLFFGCMGACVPKLFEYPVPPYIGGIAFGLSALTVIQSMGHVSGAHLNPQVTLAAFILNNIKPICVPVYIVAQFIGACIGFGLLKLVIPLQYSEGLCETLPEKNLTYIQAFIIEIVLTGGLILACGAVWDPRNAHNTDSTPIRFGFIVTCLSIVGGPFTGASMNTARTFAPILINGSWMSHQWVYWLGPTLGAVIAALLYRYVLSKPKNMGLCSK